MNTPRTARSTVRFAGLAAGVLLLLGACGESPPEEQKTGAVAPPAKTIELAQIIPAE
jgi:hypothetical protein